MAKHSIAHIGHIFQEQNKRTPHNSGPPEVRLS